MQSIVKKENSSGSITVLELKIVLSNIAIPVTEIIEIINILPIDKIQLKRDIFILRSEDKMLNSIPFKQFVILFPPRNCKAPSKPPLWISTPVIPILYSKLEPDTSPKYDWAIIRSKIIPRVGTRRLKTILELIWRLFAGPGK